MFTETIIKKNIDFDKDLNIFNAKISCKVKEKNILVIGGAGTIGSSYKSKF